MTTIPRSSSRQALSPASFNEFILNPFSNDTQMQYVTMIKEFKKADVDDAWNKMTAAWARDFFRPDKKTNIVVEKPSSNAANSIKKRKSTPQEQDCTKRKKVS